METVVRERHQGHVRLKLVAGHSYTVLELRKNETTHEVKDNFHGELQSVLERVPRRCDRIVMVDKNPTVFTDTTGEKEVIGTHEMTI